MIEPMRVLGINPHPNLKTLGDTAPANPNHIWIEPTNRCNARCRHCRHYYADFGADMSEGVYARIENAVLDGVRSVHLTGYGEPLMAPLFDRMLDACLSRGMSVAFITNGILLRDDRRVARLVRQNVYIALSIEGAHAETHEFLRPYVKWAGMLETLKCLKRNADAAGREKRFTLSFNFTVLKKSVGDLPNLVLLAAKYGAASINPQPLMGSESGLYDLRGQSLAEAPEILTEPLTKALRLAAKHHIQLGIAPVFREMLLAASSGVAGRPRLGLARGVRRLLSKAALAWNYLRQRGPRQALTKLVFGFGPQAKTGKRYCLMPWRDAYFAADGTVFSCCAMGDCMGDLNREVWLDIWNGPLYRNLRRTIHSWNPSAGCRYCGLGMGINGGDDGQYGRFFGKFRAETLPLDSPAVVFADGFSPMECLPDGAPSHRWMGRRGELELSCPRGARFVRLGIIPRQPIPTANPGRCRLNGGAWEPFDNTCPELHFPVAPVHADRIRLEIEMENAPSTREDSRPLGLAIRGVAYLFPR